MTKINLLIKDIEQFESTSLATAFGGGLVDGINVGADVLDTGCSDCTSCSQCTACTGCSACSDCSSCSDCTACSACSGCSACTSCTGCSGHTNAGTCGAIPSMVSLDDIIRTVSG